MARGASMTGGASLETFIWHGKDGAVLELTFGSGGKIVAKSYLNGQGGGELFGFYPFSMGPIYPLHHIFYAENEN